MSTSIPTWTASPLIKSAILVLVFVSTVFLFSSSAPSTARPGHPSTHFFQSFSSKRKATFIYDFLTSDISGPLDNTALVALCSTREWVPGLIFECQDAEGGIANVRNIVLNCVRYAIEAGATGLILPWIIRPYAPPNVPPSPLSHLFDTEYFQNTLQASCPQLKIIPSINDLWNFPSTSPHINLTPNSLTPLIPQTSILSNPGRWTVAFRSYLIVAHPREFSTEMPIVITLRNHDNAMLQWPLSYDHPDLVSNFGKILQVREDVRHLAATTLYALSNKFDLDLDPKLGIQASKFYAAYLRTGRDTEVAGWTNYAVQSTNYLRHAEFHSIQLIYLISDNPEDEARFTEEARNRSTSIRKEVTGMTQLLSGKEFAEERDLLAELDWYQRGVIDWEVAAWAGAFGGGWESSFSWGVGMRRRVVALTRASAAPSEAEEVVQKQKRMNTGNTKVASGEGRSYYDDLSTVFGPSGKGETFVMSLWP